MSLFLIEREFAEKLEPSQASIDRVIDYNSDHDLRWLFSFLSADKKKMYCLFEAPDAAALFEQARALGVPADAVIEVGEINPDMFTAGSTVTGHMAT